MPSANTFVSVEGFVTRFDVAEGSLAVVDIHVSVDNIAFLGKANIAPPPDKPGLRFVTCRTVQHFPSPGVEERRKRAREDDL
ncbi:hypothetical protein BC826DRAFT_1108123 [Russula brevipes]|nr:hypothetical protein BC826DRAFT_1108123 [Russula brevipes]